MSETTPMYTLQEVAKLLGKSERRMRQLAPRYHAVLVGGTWRFPAHVIDAVVRGQRLATTTTPPPPEE